MPSNVLRTWHVQLALFWIATAYVAGGLLLSSTLGEREPKGQEKGVNMLFWALVLVVVVGFFELFVTVMVAVTFFQLGVVSKLTATRIIYLDAIIFLAGGMVGTAHHWYWTGQSNVTMAFAAMFSALEVVPLTLLTLDAWDLIRLTGTREKDGGKGLAIPHKWTFYFFMAVGFWNFVGAGIFGFLINLPVVSYYEAGTMLTANHGHAALMGAFGMLAMALMVLTLRQVMPDAQWPRVEKFIKISFWGMNVGLGLMVVTSLFPGGVFQLWDVMENGYWHARSAAYMTLDKISLLEWLRMPADLIFIFLGALPAVVAALLTYKYVRSQAKVEVN